MSERSDRNPNGPFTVWLDGGYDGWSPTDYPTLRAALEAEKYSSNWVIMKVVDYTITEIEPASTPPGSTTPPPVAHSATSTAPAPSATNISADHSASET